MEHDQYVNCGNCKLADSDGKSIAQPPAKRDAMTVIRADADADDVGGGPDQRGVTDKEPASAAMVMTELQI